MVVPQQVGVEYQENGVVAGLPQHWHLHGQAPAVFQMPRQTLEERRAVFRRKVIEVVVQETQVEGLGQPQLSAIS